MEAEPAASWKGFLVSSAARMRGHPCCPSIPGRGPLSSGLGFLVEDVRRLCRPHEMGEALPYLPRPGSVGTQWWRCPHPSGSKLFAPSHRRFQEEAMWLRDWPPRSPGGDPAQEGLLGPLSLSLRLPWPSRLVALPSGWGPEAVLTPSTGAHPNPIQKAQAPPELRWSPRGAEDTAFP